MERTAERLKLFALGDPHLALATPNKSMDRFGELWVDHPAKIERAWRAVVADDDIVALPGDISWALKLDRAQADLDWLGALPGRKVLCRGNHDYWWGSASKVRAVLPDSIQIVHGDAFCLDGVAFAGTRLWDVPGLSFRDAIAWRDSDGESISAPPRELSEEDRARDEKIYRRELGRLRMALEQLAKVRETDDTRLGVLLVHYPPTDLDLQPTEVTDLIERFPVDHVVFGHLHSVRRDLPRPLFGLKAGIEYHFTACDDLEFHPLEIATL